jgi:hypothetical protein
MSTYFEIFAGITLFVRLPKIPTVITLLSFPLCFHLSVIDLILILCKLMTHLGYIHYRG